MAPNIPGTAQLGPVGSSAKASKEDVRAQARVLPPAPLKLGNAVRTHLATGGQHPPS